MVLHAFHVGAGDDRGVQLADGVSLAVNIVNSHGWAARAHNDSDAAAAGGAANALGAGAEHVGLEIDLLLSAYTDPTQAHLRRAFIENKFSGLMVGISRAEPAHLPLPSTLAMPVPLLPGVLWPRPCSVLARHRA